ncbi:double stranded RNA binding [Achlya hypogyna]|uniref:RNA methyltransferase n=1 Tax=Achlya hypogyna TaxID=1202772 RepID=A0A1V9ZRX5_ACHHY|nr:double stranded RNA binding [Achlya hypogyna]
MEEDLAVEHVLGNFHDYYEFNPESERVRFLSPEVRAGLRSLFQQRPRANYLDIGCNEGKLTQAIHKAIVGGGAAPPEPSTDRTMFSVDSICELNNALQKHHETPLYVTIEDGGTGHRKHFVMHVLIGGVFFGAGDGVSKKVAKAKAAAEALARLASLADTSSPDEPTPAPTPAPTPSVVDLEAPVNLHTVGVDVDPVLIHRAKRLVAGDASGALQFDVADIMEGGRLDAICSAHLDGAATFDLVSCFSITMWIHLNHGDAGLVAFLDLVAAKATHLIVEPQPWKCYKTATRRLTRLQHRIPASFRAITITHTVVDVIDAHLSDLFPHKTPLGKTNWSRPVMLYSKVPLPSSQL